jgi:hypothetical protein
VEIMDFDIKKYISISANDEWRTQEVEIVDLVEKRRFGVASIKVSLDLLQILLTYFEVVMGREIKTLRIVCFLTAGGADRSAPPAVDWHEPKGFYQTGFYKI